MSEKPVHPRPRRLADWINPTGAKKVHSLIDQVRKGSSLQASIHSPNRSRLVSGSR
jgi:hypothetical protein